MTRQEIQEGLYKKGITQAQFAKMASVSPTAISLFIRRKFKSRKLSEKLDEILGTKGAIR